MFIMKNKNISFIILFIFFYHLFYIFGLKTVENVTTTSISKLMLVVTSGDTRLATNYMRMCIISLIWTELLIFYLI